MGKEDIGMEPEDHDETQKQGEEVAPQLIMKKETQKIYMRRPKRKKKH